MDAVHVPGRFEPEGRHRSLSERLYARLLTAYPAEFRECYAGAMVQLFADQLRDARRAGRAGAVVGTWSRALLDLASNAVTEQLRKDRTMAHSLATFEPTRSMRLLGLLGLAGAILLLSAFIAGNPIVDSSLNVLRLILFWLGGLAVALAFYRRQSEPGSALATLATGLVVSANAWNVAWVVLSIGRDSPFSGLFGEVGFLAGIAGWLAAALYGGAMLALGLAWRGMTRSAAIATRLAALALLGGSPLALLGIDRLGLVDLDAVGAAISQIAIIGVGINGLGWLLLGAVLVVGGRRRSPGAV